MTKTAVRFAFTIDAGPNVNMTSGGWRVWVNREDTYIAASHLGGIWKASLHGDTSWRIAVTKEHLATENPVYRGPERAPWNFNPTPFVRGVRFAFAVVITRPAMRPGVLDDKAVHIPVRDRWDEVTIAYVFMTEPDIALSTSRHVIGGPLILESGRRVWVAWGREPVPPKEPEAVPAGSMIEPMWPEKHGVGAPAFVLRGLHVG